MSTKPMGAETPPTLTIDERLERFERASQSFKGSAMHKAAGAVRRVYQRAESTYDKLKQSIPLFSPKKKRPETKYTVSTTELQRSLSLPKEKSTSETPAGPSSFSEMESPRPSIPSESQAARKSAKRTRRKGVLALGTKEKLKKLDLSDLPPPTMPLSPRTTPKTARKSMRTPTQPSTSETPDLPDFLSLKRTDTPGLSRLGKSPLPKTPLVPKRTDTPESLRLGASPLPKTPLVPRRIDTPKSIRFGKSPLPRTPLVPKRIDTPEPPHLGKSPLPKTPKTPGTVKSGSLPRRRLLTPLKSKFLNKTEEPSEGIEDELTSFTEEGTPKKEVPSETERKKLASKYKSTLQTMRKKFWPRHWEKPQPTPPPDLFPRSIKELTLDETDFN